MTGPGSELKYTNTLKKLSFDIFLWELIEVWGVKESENP